MIVVYRSEVGCAAMARMARDAVVRPLAHGCAAPADIPSSAGLRALALATCVPRGAVLTGAAALWVWGFGADAEAPRTVEVAVVRGAHPDAPPSCRDHTWRYVTDSAAVRTAARRGAVGVAPPASAAALALARDPWGHGLRAARWAAVALEVGDEAVLHALRRQAPTPTRDRAINAWVTVTKALRAT